jgi:glycosyltransferase involved in cell wall biosynthesis
MHQKNDAFLNDMKVQSDCIVINQSDRFEHTVSRRNGRKVEFLTFPERGVGLSRNSAIMRATADICLIADDDVVYDDDYETKVLAAFNDNPEADVIFFNLPSKNVDRPEYIIKRKERIRWSRSLRYGAFRIAFRTQSIKKANIFFSLLFGGGAKYSSGEDSLFIYQCLSKGLKIYALPISIGTVKQEESTWFKGFNDTYFHDKGALYRAISPTFGMAFALYYLMRKYSTFRNNKSPLQLFLLMLKGFQDYGKE